MEINARELVRLIELNKRKAELEFQKAVLGVECDKELNSISSKAAELAKKAEAAGIQIVFPREDKIKELGNKLREFSAEQTKEAVKSRSGPIYEILNERGSLIKKNYENRLEIAKLSLIVAKMGSDERRMLADAVRAGALKEPLTIATICEADKKRLVRFLRRCGMECTVSGLPKEGETEEKEVRIELPTRKVWVSEEIKEKLESNLNRIKEITPSIQLKNAQRHVKIFSEEEEKEFEALQQEYLELLKEQDELLREFDEEEKLSIKR